MGLGKEKDGSHYFILSSIGSYVLTIIFCILPVAAFAAWGSPAEIISGSWGSGNDQFGIRYEDTSDMFPRFTITSEGKIVVRDGINRRLKVYTRVGSFETIIPYRAGRKFTELTLADSYGFSGDFVGYGEEGANYFYRADQKVYINFSLTGQLIKTSSERPLELGKMEQSRVGGAYKIKVTYPDNIYQFTSAQPLTRYYRDLNKFLYQIEKYVTSDKIVSYRVHKYSLCGKEVSLLTLPISQYEPMPDWAHDAPTWKPAPLIEYGEPLVSPAGDVYAWARTKTQYKILKWTWVDDPNVPTGPDAPTGLSVTPSINGLYLTWTASPNDPGCVTKYEIARSTTSGGVFSTIDSVDKGVLKYNDTTAEVGTQYYYKVRAMAGSEFSPYTAEVSGKR